MPNGNPALERYKIQPFLYGEESSNFSESTGQPYKNHSKKTVRVKARY